MELREWQKQKLNEALNALITKKTLLLNVTTGAGKTLFALLLGKMLSKKILFLTRTHSEFEAVKREADRLGLKSTYLFGKNSICPYATDDVRSDEIECKYCNLKDKIKDDINQYTPSQILQISKTAKTYCPYYSLRSKIKESDVIAASYLYFFNPVIRKTIICNTTDCLSSRELLVVVDEAHNLISADEWFAISIHKKTVRNALKELDMVNKNNNEVREFLSELSSFLEKIEAVSGCKELPMYPKPSSDVLKQLHDATLSYLNLLSGPIKRSSLRLIFTFYNTEGDVFNCNGSLTLVPSNVYSLIKHAFEFADTKILMSGTLPDLGIDGYRMDVEVKLGEAEYYYCNSVDSKLKNRKANAPKYAEIIKNIYSKSSSNVIVFFPSYSFKDEVRQYLSDAPVLEESKRTTHGQLLNLMSKGKYIVTLVMRAKESEGVEFRDENNRNLFSDIILAGLPYPDVTDALMQRRITRIAEMTKKSPEEVAHEFTLITIKQTIGRALRNENDHVKIYLCDARYSEYFAELGVKRAESLAGEGSQ